MANGLSRIIKKARKANETNILARLAQKKFRVEELEDRIAPAATAAGTGELIYWNANGGADPGDFVETGDGAFVMWENDAATLSANVGMGAFTTTIDDTAGTTLAKGLYVNFDAATLANNTVITILTNGWLGNIDLSNLTIDNGNTATINIVSGSDMVFASAGSDTINYTIGGAAAGAAAITSITDISTHLAGVTAADATDATPTLAELGSGYGIGTITLPTVASSESATIILNVSSGTDDGATASADGDITAITDGSAGTLTIGNTSDIYCDDMGAITVDAIASTFDITGSAGDLTGNLTVTGAIGDINITGNVSGNISATSIGNITLGANATTTSVSGSITASTGSIGTINEAAAGATVNISGNILAETSIGIIGGSAPINTISGSIEAGTGVGAITTVGAITGAISGETVGSITTTNSNVTGGITASGGAGTVGAISIGSGTLGAVMASGTTGTITSITCGAISGNITATDTDSGGTDNVIGAIDASAAISGDISAYTIGTLDSDAAISGDITLTGGSANAIGAADITGAINITGDLTGDIITDGASGGIADLNVSGYINANITASGGSAVINAASIAASTSITIKAEDDMTLTLTGGIDGSNGGDTVLIWADSDADDGGDLTLVVGGQIDAAGDDDVDLTGENISFSTTSETQTYIYDFGTIQADNNVTIGTLDGDLKATTIQATDGSIGNITVGGLINVGTITAPDTDANNTGSIGNITAGESITVSTALTADQTIGNIAAETALSFNGITVTAPAGLGTLDAGTTLNFGTISVTAGGVGAITADDAISGAAITVAAGNLGAISAGTTLSVTGNVAVTTGNIGNISSLGNMTIAGNWTATAGSIGTISAGDADNDNKTITISDTKAITAGTTIGAISATGDISSTGTSTIVAGAQKVVSGTILSVSDNDVLYVIESDNAVATDSFDITFTLSGADNKAAIDITRVGTGDLNLALTTSDTDDTVNTAEFDLAASGLTVASGAKTFGTITVEGDIAGAINLGTGSSAIAIIAQDLISGTISVDTLSLLAGSNVVDAETADSLTASSSVSGADPNAVAIAGTFVLPIANGATNEVVAAMAAGKFSNDNSINLGMVAVTGDATLVQTLSYTAGALSGVAGEGAITIADDITAATDFSNIGGNITITGSVTGAVTFGDDAGDITIGGVGETISGALTFGNMTGNVAITGDVSGTVVAGDVTGDVTITGDVSSAVTLGDVDGTVLVSGNTSGIVTVGDVTGDVTIDDDVSAAVTVGDVDGTVSIGFGDDVTANVTVGDITGAGNDLVLGTVGAGVTVTAGEIADDVTVASIVATSALNIGGSDAITVAGDMLGTITSAGDIGDLTISGDFGSVISITGDAGTITLTDDTGDGIVGSVTSTLTVTGNMAALDVIDTAAAAVTMEVLFASITIGDGHLTVTNSQGDDVVGLTVPSLKLGITGDAGDGTTGDIVIDGTTYVNVTALDAAIFGALAFDSAATSNAQTLTITNAVLFDANSAGAETLVITSASAGNIYAGDTVDVAITVDDPSTTDANDGVVGSVIIDDDANVASLGLTVGGAVIDTFDGGAAKVSTGNAFTITAGSIGDISVEENFNFTTITANAGGITSITAQSGDIVDSNGGAGISATDGNVGAITSDGLITSDITVTDGNLGMIVADGAINSDISVSEGKTFAGMVSTGGAYTGAFNVEGVVSSAIVLLTGAFGDTNVPAFDTDLFAMFSDGAGFATAAYSSVDTVTVVGATTLVTLSGATMTVANSVVGSTVTVDETEGNVATTVNVDGDLAGAITFTGDMADPATVNTLTVDGNLSGTFTAQDDIANLTVQGDWSGNVVLSDSNPYLASTPEVTSITVWGSVATANLSGATYGTAVDLNGDALSAAAPASVTKAAVYLVPNSAGDGVGQYVYVTGNGVTAMVSSLFGQVSGIELVGKGSTQLISIESDTAPTVAEIKKAASYGQKMIKGNEVANDFIDFDAPGTANLPAVTVAPRVAISGLTVDGDFGGFSDIQSNLRNVFVSGEAQDITVAKNLINAYFGEANSLLATKISGVHVETNAVSMTAASISNVDVEGAVAGSILATKLSGVDIMGSVAGTVAGSNINKLFVGGNVGTLKSASINNSVVAGNVATLFMQPNVNHRASIIKNSMLANVGADNIDFYGVDETTGYLNDTYNPVKIVRSIVDC